MSRYVISAETNTMENPFILTPGENIESVTSIDLNGKYVNFGDNPSTEQQQACKFYDSSKGRTKLVALTSITSGIIINVNMAGAFENNTVLTDAAFSCPNAIKIDGLFDGCSKLTAATIECPKVEIAYSMFKNTKVKELFIEMPNAVHINMFLSNNSNITEANIYAPNALSATTLFAGCSDLKTATVFLHKVTGWTKDNIIESNIGIPNMFGGCTSLTSATVFISDQTAEVLSNWSGNTNYYVSDVFGLDYTKYEANISKVKFEDGTELNAVFIKQKLV